MGTVRICKGEEVTVYKNVEDFYIFGDFLEVSLKSDGWQTFHVELRNSFDIRFLGAGDKIDNWEDNDAGDIGELLIEETDVDLNILSGKISNVSNCPALFVDGVYGKKKKLFEKSNVKVDKEEVEKRTTTMKANKKILDGKVLIELCGDFCDVYILDYKKNCKSIYMRKVFIRDCDSTSPINIKGKVKKADPTVPVKTTSVVGKE